MQNTKVKIINRTNKIKSIEMFGFSVCLKKLWQLQNLLTSRQWKIKIRIIEITYINNKMQRIMQLKNP